MKIVVIGGGPGGHSAAFEAARLGAEVTLIEKEHLGGTCLNWGCIPTKTILRSAKIALDTRNAAKYGLRARGAEVDIDALRDRKEGVIEELRSQIESTAKRLKVNVVHGVGRLVAPRKVEVVVMHGPPEVLEPDAIILATGSVVFKLPNIDHGMAGVWTSDQAVSLTEIPERLLLIGGGVIGLEFATAYAAFGSKVTVVELMPTVLPGNDKRVTRAAQQAAEELGISFRLGEKVETVERRSGVMYSTLNTGEVIESDIVFSAVGRVPNSMGLGCESAGIEMNRAAVTVDEFYRTNVPGTYAIGDLVGGLMLAHVAEDEGVAAARNACEEHEAAEKGREPVLESVCHDCVPACVYTFPEVAVVGSSRDSAKEEGLDAIQAVAKFSANGKALGEGEGSGFVQIVAENGTGKILGCQIVGPHAVEIIHEVAVSMHHGLTVGDIADSVHAHPTVSEVIKAAATEARIKCGV